MGGIDNDGAGVAGGSALLYESESIDPGHAQVGHQGLETLWGFPEFPESIEAIVGGLHFKAGCGEGGLQGGEKNVVIIDTKETRARSAG